MISNRKDKMIKKEATRKNNINIPYLLWERDPNKVMIFIEGSGLQTNKERITPLAEILHDQPYSFCSFSYNGIEEGLESSVTEKSKDLKALISDLQSNGYDEFILVPTSQGFVTTVKMLLEQDLDIDISRIILLDPADYYTNDSTPFAWSGRDEFKPNGEVYSEKLKDLSIDCPIDVVYFSTRIWDPTYPEMSYYERGIDKPHGIPRLNKDMVVNIYENIPDDKRGEFIESPSLPHGLFVYGDIEKNMEALRGLFIRLIK